MIRTSGRPANRLPDLFAYLILAAVASAQLWPGLGRDLAAPMSWDHGAHLGKAILTWGRLGQGIRSWAPEVEAGVPLNTLYSPTGSLWVVLVRALTPFLAWHQTYALAIAAFRFLVGFAPYRLARAAGAGPASALAAGIIALADMGDHSEGGFFYDVLFGVWPMSLAMVLFVIGLAETWLAVSSSSPRRAALAALLLGAALFSHPMAALAIALVTPAMLACLAAEKAPGRSALQFLSIVSIAGLLAMWWLLPMLTWNEWLDDHGQMYRTLGDLGTALGRGQPILDRLTPAEQRSTWVGAFASVALVWGLLGTGLRRVAAITAAACWLVSSNDWLANGDAIAWAPYLGRIMFPRFQMIAKPLVFALTGVMLGELGSQALARLGGVWSAPKLLARSWALLLLAPFAPAVAAHAFAAIAVRPNAGYTVPGSGFDSYLQYAAWMRDQPGAFFRVAYLNEHSHIFQSAGALTGRPAHKIGALIAEVFRNVSDSAQPDALRELGVRYVVTWGSSLPNPLSAEVRPVKRFGPIEVFELMHADLREVVGDGSVQPAVTSRSNSELRISPGGAAKLVVRHAYAPGWHGAADGRPIEVVPLAAHPDSPHLRFMEVRVPPGAREITLAYDGLTAPVVVGWAVTLLGLALAATLVFMPGRVRSIVSPILQRAEQVRAPRRLVVAGLGMALVLGLGAFTLRARASLRQGVPTVSILDSDGRAEPCSAHNAQGGISCASESWVGYTKAVTPVDGRLRSCFGAHPPSPGRTLKIRFAGVLVTNAVGIEAGVSDDAMWRGTEAPIEVEIQANSQEIGKLEVPAGRAWIERSIPLRPGVYDITYLLRTADAARRWFCFVPRFD